MPSLTLNKQVTNNNGGTAVAADWLLQADGPAAFVGSGPTVVSGAGQLPCTYNLSETGPDGYTRTSLTCDNTVGQVESVTLGLGEDVTCTFVNDDVGDALIFQDGFESN